MHWQSDMDNAHILRLNENVQTQKAQRHYKIFLLKKEFCAFHDNVLVKMEETYFEVIHFFKL
jgi:hypothetical protein